MDTTITNALIYDGSGGAPYQGDIGVAEGRIAKVSPTLAADSCVRVLDATGLACCPGFIDGHSHSDLNGRILAVPMAENVVQQGITTIVAGNCGNSAWPVGAHLDAVERAGVSVNYALLAGLGTLRHARPGDPEEALAEALTQGAVGMSDGSPCARDESLDHLLALLERRNRVYAPHSLAVFHAAVDEVDACIESARCTGVRTHISHVGMRDREQWGNSARVLQALDAAIDARLDVSINVYPYDAGYAGWWAMLVPGPYHSDPDVRRKMSTREAGLREDVAARIRSLGGADKVRLGDARDLGEAGETIDVIAAREGLEPVDVAIDLVTQSPGAMVHCESEEDLQRLMRHRVCTIVTDGYAQPEDCPYAHPHDFGTFPRVLGRYARVLELFPLEDIIRRMTSLPARLFGFPDRGRIEAGARADLVVFDPATVRDTATYEAPCQHPEGIHYVLVNGRVTVARSEHTGVRAGQVLRGEAAA
jgi:N-acyl-D-amino-acid deacylase